MGLTGTKTSHNNQQQQNNCMILWHGPLSCHLGTNTTSAQQYAYSAQQIPGQTDDDRSLCFSVTMNSDRILRFQSICL